MSLSFSAVSLTGSSPDSPLLIPDGGRGSLSRDSDEIAQLAEYLKSPNGGSRTQIGLMGHSTGATGTCHYFTNQPKGDLTKFSPLDFAILQAPVSGRTAGGAFVPPQEFKDSVTLAKELLAKGQSGEIMPSKYSKFFFNSPISAYRWNSLMSHGGDDDLFTYDLNEEELSKTFSSFGKPFLVLYSSEDEFVPKEINKRNILDKWAKAAGDN